MSAEEAMQLGFASRLAARDKLLESALELVRTMNSKNPMGLRLTKEAINVNLDAGGLEQALQREDRNQTLLVARALLSKGEKKGKYFQKKNAGDRTQKTVVTSRFLTGLFLPVARIHPVISRQ